MVQVEELEGRFAEFDEYIEELARKREEIYEAFEGRKQALVEQRNRRAGNLLKSAERILAGLKHRAASLDDINTINGYFAGDLMVSKLRDIIAELRDIGDSVKADDLQTRLKTVQDDAVRQLKDRKELVRRWRQRRSNSAGTIFRSTRRNWSSRSSATRARCASIYQAPRFSSRWKTRSSSPPARCGTSRW